MGEKRCIMCGEHRGGIPIREDAILHAMRWFNRKVMRKERNFRLLVCKDCYLKYNKLRKNYLKKQVSYLAIGVLFAALLIAVSGGNPFAIVYGLVVIAAMYLLSIISYMPDLDIPDERKKELMREERRDRNLK